MLLGRPCVGGKELSQTEKQAPVHRALPSCVRVT